MPAFVTYILEGVPYLLGQALSLFATVLGLRNQAPIVHGKQTVVVVQDDKTNTDVVQNAIDTGDVTVIQDKGNVK